jgi:hypothetical protein
LNFPDRFSKNAEISNLMKILSVGVELLHADGQTDMTKLIVAFRNFSNTSKIFVNMTLCLLSGVNSNREKEIN